MKTSKEWSQFFLDSVLQNKAPVMSPDDCIELAILLKLHEVAPGPSAVVAVEVERPIGSSELHQNALDQQVATLVRSHMSKDTLCSCPKCLENRV